MSALHIAPECRPGTFRQIAAIAIRTELLRASLIALYPASGRRSGSTAMITAVISVSTPA